MPDQQTTMTLNLVSINLLESNLWFDPEIRYPLSTYNYRINVENKFDLEKSKAIVVVDVILTEEESGKELGQVKTSIVFEVQNLEKYIEQNENESLIPTSDNTMLVTLNSLALSTTRGILFMTFKGTHLHNALLPIVDPTTLVAQAEG